MVFFLIFLFAVGGVVLYALPALAAFGILRAIARTLRRTRIARQLRPILHTAAHRLELPSVQKRSLFGVRVDGKLDGYELSIAQDDHPHTSHRDGLRFTVIAPAVLPPRLLITSRDVRLPTVLATPPVKTFDDDFDRYFEVHGRALDVATRLDPSIRSRMLALSADGTIITQDNTITLTTYAPVFFGPSIVRIAERLVDLARDLIGDTSEPAAHLLANAMSEPRVAARYQALDFLLREYSGTREADEALRIAWDAPERGIRYLAAIRNGEVGLSFLEETAELSSEPVRLRAMAMRHFARHAAPERALPLLRRTLRLRTAELLRAAIELIGRLQDRESLAMLVTLGRRNYDDTEIRALIAHSIGQLGDSAGEEFLLEELYAAAIEVRLGAVQALGKIGTPHALGPLNRLVGRAFTTRDLGLAARSAIARIEARCGPGERGRLSITDGGGMGGALSYQPEEGALSIKDDAV